MGTSRVRGLSPAFLDSLKNGVLREVHQLVLADKTLSMFIRDGYVNIYYRGGNLLKIAERRGGGYTFKFNTNYAKTKSRKIAAVLGSPNWTALKQVSSVKSIEDARVWLQQLPQLKQCMDIWFGEHPRDEREFQQLIARVNNSSKFTDYFIVDIEYTNSDNKNIRADMLALYWPRTRAARNKNFKPRLTVIEVKARDHALKGKAGVVAHVSNLRTALLGRINLKNLGVEVMAVFEQMLQLKLITCDIEGVAGAKRAIEQGKLDFVFFFADHDPDSTIIRQELKRIQSPVVVGLGQAKVCVAIKVAQASQCGFGLFEQRTLDLPGAIAII